MSWFIVWIVLSIAVGVFANNRGRSGGGWFLLSLLISPLLGLIFVAVSKDLLKEAQVKASTPGPETHVKCPHCAEWVLPEATVCKHCHSALQPDPEFKAKATTQRTTQQALDIKTRRIYIGVIAGIALALYAVKTVVSMAN